MFLFFVKDSLRRKLFKGQQGNFYSKNKRTKGGSSRKVTLDSVILEFPLYNVIFSSKILVRSWGDSSVGKVLGI